MEQGYAFIHADTRGTGQSREGRWSLWSTEEQTDLYDTIEWVADQPWSNGKVGMVGESIMPPPNGSQRRSTRRIWPVSPPTTVSPTSIGTRYIMAASAP